MRKLSVLLCALGGVGLLWLPSLAQEPGAGILFAQRRQFGIPFKEVPPNVKQLQLYVSVDQGRSWHPSATATPAEHSFRFASDRDGYFWFAVQTTDTQGKVYPPSLEGAQPSLKVVVDTVPPQVSLQPLAPRGNEVGVGWAVRDENLDVAGPDAFQLDYRLAGSVTWLPLAINPVAQQHYWNPQANGLVEVRLKTRDRAGNLGEGTATVSLAGGGSGSRPAPDPTFAGNADAGPRAPREAQMPADPDRRLVNSETVTLNYDLKELGPSGISEIELWYTMDGRSWEKYPQRYGQDPDQRNISFKVAGEGMYGITLLAKSGVGLGDRPPQIGDRPQVWIEVDTTKPRVQINHVTVGSGAEKGKMSVTWQASDKNLERTPIALSYAEKLDGPWKTFAEKLPNSQRYIWQIPEGTPYQFHVKIEAADRAGNVGEAITENLVKVDLSSPKVQILNVAPGGK